LQKLRQCTAWMCTGLCCLIIVSALGYGCGSAWAPSARGWWWC